MNVTSCPSCENRINVSGHLLVGQIVSCQKCYEVFKIVSTNPLTLDFVDVEPDDGYSGNYIKPNTGGKKNKKGQKVDFDDISDMEYQHPRKGTSTKSKKRRKKNLDFEDYY